MTGVAAVPGATGIASADTTPACGVPYLDATNPNLVHLICFWTHPGDIAVLGLDNSSYGRPDVIEGTNLAAGSSVTVDWTYSDPHGFAMAGSFYGWVFSGQTGQVATRTPSVLLSLPGDSLGEGGGNPGGTVGGCKGSRCHF